MAQIDFRKKINWHRRYRSPQGVKTEHEMRFSPERLIMHYWKMPANAAIFLSYIKMSL